MPMGVSFRHDATDEDHPHIVRIVDTEYEADDIDRCLSRRERTGMGGRSLRAFRANT
jgi:hypothetical protein